MKTLITSNEPRISSQMDLRFGRAKWFCIYDHETDDIQFIENMHADAQGGAGVKIAEMTAGLGVSRVMSGHFGPKAKEILDKFDIQLIEVADEVSVETLIQNINNNSKQKLNI